MRTAGLIVGILGSFAGFIGAVIALLLGGVGLALGADKAESVTAWAFVALGASIMGLVGAALSMAKPRAAAGLMLASAIVGTVAVEVAYLLAAVLLLIGAILAFLGRGRASVSG